MVTERVLKIAAVRRGGSWGPNHPGYLTMTFLLVTISSSCVVFQVRCSRRRRKRVDSEFPNVFYAIPNSTYRLKSQRSKAHGEGGATLDGTIDSTIDDGQNLMRRTLLHVSPYAQYRALRCHGRPVFFEDFNGVMSAILLREVKTSANREN